MRAQNAVSFFSLVALAAGLTLASGVLQPATAQPVLKGETIAVPSPIGPIPRYPISFILGNLDGSKPVSSLIQSSLKLNDLTPLSIETVASHPDFTGQVLVLKVRVSSMYDTYIDPFTPFEQEYVVTGLYEDGTTPLEANGVIGFFTIRSGDANEDGFADVADVVTAVDYLFVTGNEPAALANLDMDRNGTMDISDVMMLVSYVFGI